MGMAPTQLKRARQCISKAALGSSNGRNLDRTFHVLDGSTGTLDPRAVVVSYRAQTLGVSLVGAVGSWRGSKSGV